MRRPSRWRRELVFATSLRQLPRRVARFQWRARQLAAVLGDDFSLVSATRPNKLAVLLAAGRGARTVVELGTGTAWTTVSLALADPRRTVLSLDPEVRQTRDRYLGLVAPTVQGRIQFVTRSGEAGPAAGAPPIELLYIDGSHGRDETLATWRAWEPVLAPGAVVVFDDYDHPDFPGVRQAVAELELKGTERAGLFLYRAASRA